MEAFEPRAPATPRPKASIKGTVIGPVVTPPESKATAINSLGTKIAIRKTMRYRMISITFNLICNTIRTKASAKKTPTPRATITINRTFGIVCCICSARTIKSGSAIVIINPIATVTPINIQIFFFLVTNCPICSPIFIIEESAPRLKKLNPKISIIAPIKKANIVQPETGKIQHNIKTTIVIGTTAIKDSFIFSSNAFITISFLLDF